MNAITLNIKADTMTTNVNPLASSCMLASLSVSQWSAFKIDRAATRKVIDDAGASATAGRFNKALLGKDALGTIQALVNEMRGFHYEQTSPWLDDGPRILAVANHATYWPQMEKYEERFAQLADDFARNYPDYVAAARDQLGTLYRAADYPSPSRVRGLFRMSISLLPLPDKADFRADIPAKHLARVKAELDQRAKDTADMIARDLFERVFTRVSKMADKLASYKPKTDTSPAEGVFRDSLVENVADLLDMLPRMNAGQDARIAELVRKIKPLTKHTADTLRSDDKLRADAAQQAADIVQAVSAFMA